MIPGRPARGMTVRVGSFPANAFGLHDMHGNVSEWCHDWYDDEAYNARTGTTDDPFVECCFQRANRGGSWKVNQGLVRSAYRHYYPPEFRNFSLGFRVARSAVK